MCREVLLTLVSLSVASTSGQHVFIALMFPLQRGVPLPEASACPREVHVDAAWRETKYRLS